MRDVTVFAVLLLGVSACHGIAPSTPSLITPPPVSQAPTALQVTPSPATLPIGGGTSVIRVAVLAGLSGVRNTRVILTASRGTLARSEVLTDQYGFTSVEWVGAETGTITATAGALSTDARIVVEIPVPLPVPSVPRPPPPPPTPDPPQPPQPPSPSVTVATTASVPRNTGATFIATAHGLSAGETILAYEWDFDTAAGPTTDSMTLDQSVINSYPLIGVYTVGVTVRTSTGRAIVGTTKLIVTN